MNSTATCSTWRGWAPPGCALPVTHHVKTSNHTIPDLSPPESTRTSPSAVHQDGGVKYATGALSKIRGRDNITIDTWNTRTLRAAGKLQELTLKWTGTDGTFLDSVKRDGGTLAKQQQRQETEVFYSGREDKHEHDVGFLVHKDIVNTVMGCHPVSSRLINHPPESSQFQRYTSTSVGPSVSP